MLMWLHRKDKKWNEYSRKILELEEPGLIGVFRRNRYNMGPHLGLQEYIALGTVSALKDTTIAFRILNNWQMRRANFSPYKEGFSIRKWSHYFWIYPQLYAHLQWAVAKVSKAKPRAHYRLAWLLYVLFLSFSKDRERLATGWYMTIIAPKKGVEGWARRVFSKRFTKRYPHGLGQLISERFNNLAHPNAIMMWGNFGKSKNFT